MKKQTLLRDAKGHFISQKKKTTAVKSPVKKQIVKKPVSKPATKPAVRKPDVVTKTKAVPYTTTKTLEVQGTTRGRISGTSATGQSQKQTLYLWIDDKFQFKIAPYPASSQLLNQHTTIKPLVPLHDPQVNIISLKRAIRNAEETYNISNGIKLNE